MRGAGIPSALSANRKEVRNIATYRVVHNLTQQGVTPYRKYQIPEWGTLSNGATKKIDLHQTYSSFTAAVEAAKARYRYKKQMGLATDLILGVTEDGDLVYELRDLSGELGRETINSQYGRHAMAAVVSHVPGKEPDMSQTLNVTRTKLIKALEDAQQALRDKAEQERAEALKKFDERVKILREQAGTATLNDVLSNLFRGDEYVGYKHEAFAQDETIAKQLRVLKLAEDKTVEVTPTDPFYSYL